MRFRSLVAANSLYGIQDPEFLALTDRLRPQSQFNQLPPDFRELGPSYRAANAEGAQRWIELERIGRPPEPLPPQVHWNRLTFALLETITRPTLLITGDADLYAPPPVQRLLADWIKHAESLVIAEAGHSAYWERPEIFNRAVLAFIQRVDREE